jgi:dCMP deaminase
MSLNPDASDRAPLPSPDMFDGSAEAVTRVLTPLVSAAQALTRQGVGSIPSWTRDPWGHIRAVQTGYGGSSNMVEGTSRPTRDVVLMEIAHVIAKRSTCSRAQVGALVTRKGRILSTGYNGAPAGMAHCNHRYQSPLDSRGCNTAVHAEANAVAFAARYGVRTDGADIFSTLAPCLACAQLIINCGITRVVCGGTYRDPAGFQLLVGANIRILNLADV